jgi:vancomycin permeability regulator SanA
MGKIRWVIGGSDNYRDSYLEVDEGKGWVKYNASKFYKADTIRGSSAGFRTMQECLAAGYTFDEPKRTQVEEKPSTIELREDNLSEILGYEPGW